MSEPKENKVLLEFQCYTDNVSECVYFKKRINNNRCMYEMHLNCFSKVAQANALTLKLKEIIGE